MVERKESIGKGRGRYSENKGSILIRKVPRERYEVKLLTRKYTDYDLH